MQNVERDLKEAFRGTLSGNYEERRQTIERVFSKDAKFWCATVCTKASVHPLTRASYACSCLLRMPKSVFLTVQHTDICVLEQALGSRGLWCASDYLFDASAAFVQMFCIC